jgi:ubiquitin C-terminal hydrolase
MASHVPQSCDTRACLVRAPLWLCATCGVVGCSRDAGAHGVQHFESTRHPLCVRVPDGVLWCHLCEEYVFGDASPSLKRLQALVQGAAAPPAAPAAAPSLPAFSRVALAHMATGDAIDYAEAFNRFLLLRRVFRALAKGAAGTRAGARKRPRAASAAPAPPPPPPRLVPVLPPGRTGLRNLGNTCYINSTLQCLGRLECLRHFFTDSFLREERSGAEGGAALEPLQQYLPQVGRTWVSVGDSAAAAAAVARDSSSSLLDATKETMEASGRRGGGGDKGLAGGVAGLLHVLCAAATAKIWSRGGGGGNSGGGAAAAAAADLSGSTLAAHVSATLRILWSGRWAVLTPAALVQDVKKKLPAFNSYAQMDAREFLEALLDALHEELRGGAAVDGGGGAHKRAPSGIIARSFGGSMQCSIKCSGCGRESASIEPSLLLGLQLPAAGGGSKTLRACLSSTFADERLEGENAYACVRCAVNTKAIKRVRLHALPHVLAVAVARGRGHDAPKLQTHVVFPLQLTAAELAPWLSEEAAAAYKKAPAVFALRGVVEHKGRALGAGHYVAHVADGADHALVFDDARAAPEPLEALRGAQAYLLFYERERE